MYTFFILGLIPGTNLQITFQMWIDGLELVAAVAGLAWIYRQHHAAVAELFVPRQPLHANQLHHRVSFN